MDAPPETLLRDRGLRVTAPRLAVLQILRDGGHLSAEAVATAARDRLGSVSTQGVYNVLADLAGAGIVRTIEPAGSPVLYEIDRRTRHHHLVCRGCRAVVDVPCDHADDPCQSPAARHGYTAIEAELVFWGDCPACRRRRRPT